MLVYIPLKYDKIFCCIHCLLFLWQPLRLDVFFEIGDFRLLKEIDQRICIKFCVKNEIKCKKVCEMLTKAYGESAMSKTRVYEWFPIWP